MPVVGQMTGKRWAMLCAIRLGEGTYYQGEAGYRVLVGGRLLPDGWERRHPHLIVKLTPTLSSSAAGAYQILWRTWDTCRLALNLPDFGPRSQDRAALFLIRHRLADPEMFPSLSMQTLLRRCNREWASLPGSPYGQRTVPMSGLLGVYRKELALWNAGVRPAHYSQPAGSST